MNAELKSFVFFSRKIIHDLLCVYHIALNSMTKHISIYVCKVSDDERKEVK